MNDLLLRQEGLQTKGLKIVEELGLERIFGQFGRFKLVGSICYGLMTWRDIDVDVVMPNEPTNEEYWAMAKILFSIPGTTTLVLADNRHGVEKDRPKSMYLGLRFKDEEKNVWKIDIRLLSEKSAITDQAAQLINEKITDDSRQYILQIKSQVHDNPKYHKEFSSVDIYEAVLLKGVCDLGGFKTYLSDIGKSL